jgi:hypothetical protein
MADEESHISKGTFVFFVQVRTDFWCRFQPGDSSVALVQFTFWKNIFFPIIKLL